MFAFGNLATYRKVTVRQRGIFHALAARLPCHFDEWRWNFASSPTRSFFGTDHISTDRCSARCAGDSCPGRKRAKAYKIVFDGRTPTAWRWHAASFGYA